MQCRNRIVREVTPADQLHANGQGDVDHVIKAVSDSIEKKAKTVTDKEGGMKRLAATPVVQGLAQVCTFSFIFIFIKVLNMC